MSESNLKQRYEERNSEDEDAEMRNGIIILSVILVLVFVLLWLFVLVLS